MILGTLRAIPGATYVLGGLGGILGTLFLFLGSASGRIVGDAVVLRRRSHHRKIGDLPLSRHADALRICGFPIIKARMSLTTLTTQMSMSSLSRSQYCTYNYRSALPSSRATFLMSLDSSTVASIVTWRRAWAQCLRCTDSSFSIALDDRICGEAIVPIVGCPSQFISGTMA
jgi:hypothetical protein